MSLFQRTSSTIRDKLAALGRDLAAARDDLAKHALQSAIDDTPAADAAQAEIYRLTQKHEVLTRALDAALAAEREADAAKARAAASSIARAADQHAARMRRSCEAMHDDIARLVEHHVDAKAALERLVAVVGDPRQYPGLSTVDLARAIAAEMFRASAVPTQYGDRSDLPGAITTSGTPANRLPSLTEVADTATRFWTQRHRALLGLHPAPDRGAGTGQDAREAAPAPDATPFAYPLPSVPPAPPDRPRYGISLKEAGR